MKRQWLLLFILLAILALTGCGTAPAASNNAVVSAPTTTTNQIVAAPTPKTSGAGYAHPEVLVDTTWVADHLKDSNVRLMDVSSKREVYDKGHLVGAVYVNVSDELTNPQDAVKGQVATQSQLETVLGRLGILPNSTVVLYDDMNGLYATRAFWVLRYYGHEKVVVLNGGSARWTAEGRELSIQVPTIMTTQYKARAAAGDMRVTWDYVLAALDKPGIVIVDVRSAKEYTGEQVRAARGGHIPGAVNVEWNKAMAADGTFRPFEELTRLYERAGATRDKEIITHCQTGVRAAHTWFVLKYLLGYDRVVLYDGSWEEWGNRADLPVTAEMATVAATPTALPDPCE